jgi:hypothetical protein
MKKTAADTTHFVSTTEITLCFYHIQAHRVRVVHFCMSMTAAKKPSHLEMSIILRLGEYKGVIPSSLEMFSV